MTRPRSSLVSLADTPWYHVVSRCVRKQLRLVQAWVELHREDLLANWDLASNGEEPFPIAPLR